MCIYTICIYTLCIYIYMYMHIYIYIVMCSGAYIQENCVCGPLAPCGPPICEEEVSASC